MQYLVRKKPAIIVIAANRKGKFKFPKELRELGEEIGHSIRPTIHKLIAKSLDLDIRAVQIWDIKEQLNEKLKAS